MLNNQQTYLLNYISILLQMYLYSYVKLGVLLFMPENIGYYITEVV